MRGFWWKGFQTNRFRGMYRFVDRDRYDAAARRASRRAHADDLVAACRQLFYDLLWFRVEEEARALALVEQSTDTVAQAETLTRVFPEARFIHVVRDGRDASASRVAQTRGLVRPRTRVQGIEWWERADPRDRARRRRDPRGPAADRQPRRARAHASAPGWRCGRCFASSAPR